MFRVASAARSLGWLVCIFLASSRPALADDHASAQAIVVQLEGDPARATAVGEPLEQARDAIERATRMRAAGDESHARAADGLALEWAEAARDVARAVEVEKTAADLKRKVMAEQAQIQRARALIEEGIVRVGRLRKELEESLTRVRLPHDPREGRTAVEVHDGDPPRPVTAAATAHPATASAATPVGGKP